jgi:hypothetical protein
MGIFSKENGKMEKHLEKEHFIAKRMNLSMMVNIKMIFNMVKEKKFGKLV